ncbi:MAG: flagellar basal body P-ring formation chaperone FlgA [Rhodospirillum sp.]|nr:flagellar basal body P-ring formation chaperone FlgA [Rhodospirillum sp.]MCF8490668.1 flagellar basal body P-ring formation chaperone FlgA [Rhodospirillum sp.]
MTNPRFIPRFSANLGPSLGPSLGHRRFRTSGIRLARLALIGLTSALAQMTGGAVSPAWANEVPADILSTVDPVEALLAPGQPVNLIRASDVEGPYITLGDLFTGVGDRASIPVARAPQAGRAAILDAEWLTRTAQANDLDWHPQGSFVQAVVTRPGVTVPTEDILAALRQALKRHGAPQDGEIHLSTAQRTLTIPSDVPMDIGVSEDQYDPSTGRFSAMIEAPIGSPEAEYLRLSGRIIATRDVPVPLRRLSRTEVIDAHDLEYIRVRVDRLPKDAILDAESLIGHSPRTFLRDGEPVRISAVVNPTVVEKGALVTMELRMPGMSLTAQGRAMEAAGQGETLRVSNTGSNQVVLATVAGPNRVIVHTPGIGVAQTASR